MKRAKRADRVFGKKCRGGTCKVKSEPRREESSEYVRGPDGTGVYKVSTASEDVAEISAGVALRAEHEANRVHWIGSAIGFLALKRQNERCVSCQDDYAKIIDFLESNL